MTKIYDGFLFNNEFELLELRLQEHWDHVDKFILVESTINHRGEPKPLYYGDNKSRFTQYKEKIQHIAVTHINNNSPYVWGKTTTGSPNDQQRNHIPWGLYDANPDDILLICDVDELIRPEAFELMKNNQTHSTFSPLQTLSHFKINFMCATINDPINCHGYLAWSKGVRVSSLKQFWLWDATGVKANSYLSCINPNLDILAKLNTLVIPHGGWHFSWWGTKEDILDKMSTYGHQELDNPFARKLVESETLIEGRINGFRTPQVGNMFPLHKWIASEIDSYFPKTILDNLDRYQHVIYPNPSEHIKDYLPPYTYNPPEPPNALAKELMQNVIDSLTG